MRGEEEERRRSVGEKGEREGRETGREGEVREGTE